MVGSGSFRRDGVDPDALPLPSLQLPLLAFFILPTSLSDFQDPRTRMVLESVDEACNAQGPSRATRRRPGSSNSPIWWCCRPVS